MWKKIKDFKQIKDFPINVLRQTHAKCGGELRKKSEFKLISFLILSAFDKNDII